MTIVVNLLEPKRLLLSWQRPLVDAGRRTRHVVGEITRDSAGNAVFSYLYDTVDFKQAEEEGFQGFPAFRLGQLAYTDNVLEAFSCRLPSRKRGDFAEYLIAHCLPIDFAGSDFSLLAHTGARLPGDGFEIFPDVDSISLPFDLVVEVAGTRHQGLSALDGLSIGDMVDLCAEPDNPIDPTAIVIRHEKMGVLGYIPKPYCPYLQPLIAAGRIAARICKLNGRPERRLIYLLLSAKS